MYTIIGTLVTLGILVTIHEWGHFYVARRCGVKVLRFSIGFGKPLCKWVSRRSGTEYVVAAIPLGGYVRMLDEREGEVAPDEKDQAFNNKSVWQRIAIVVAGPAVNLIFAVFAYWVMFVSGVTVAVPLIGEVTPGSLAEQAGIRRGGEVVQVDGARTQSWDEVNLRLAARVGESGDLSLRVRYPDSSLPEEHRLQLQRWAVKIESEMPVTALGLEPQRPPVPPVIGRVLAGGAAERAGLQVADRVLAIDGQSIETWQELVTKIKASPGQELNFLLQRGDRQLALPMVPDEKDEAGQIVGFVGAGVSENFQTPPHMLRQISYGSIAAVAVAFEKTGQMIALTLESIWKMIEGVISVKSLSGPITIAKVAGASAASGFEDFVSFLAYLSISLGILNLLPIPMLDGGHLLYYVVELVRGKPVTERVQMIGLRIGMTLLLTLMTVAIFNDVMRL